MRRLLATLAAVLSAATLVTNLTAALPAASGGAASIATPKLREWLSYLASDELQGRAVFSEGFGLAGGYIADQSKTFADGEAVTFPKNMAASRR